MAWEKMISQRELVAAFGVWNGAFNQNPDTFLDEGEWIASDEEETYSEAQARTLINLIDRGTVNS